MPVRQDASKDVTTTVNHRTAGQFSRRRILQLSGTALAAGAVASGTASGDDHAEDSTDEVAADGGPLGGGDGYDAVVPPEAADVVVDTRDGLDEALTSATSGDVVYVDGDASIDLGDETVTVPDGVTLASDRGIDGAAGGHLHTDSETDVVDIGDEGRVTGLRLEGPFYEFFDPSWYARGSGLRALGEDVVIDNCEVWGFAYAAIYAHGDAHVHHNHVHHNARDGLGYGVVTVAGHPVIEWNYFEYNRHSVASSGDHHGYTVRYNHFGSDAAGIVIDVHRPGGVRSAVYNNIVEAVDDVQGRHDPLQAIQVRGVPDESYDVHENWFFNPNEPRSRPAGSWTTEAIIQPTETAWRNVSFRDNFYGEDAAVEADDIIPGYVI